ncbi:hypothetical protein GCM10010299_54180 [Streptomyces tanashiensis]|nr:hypothetical protein GCM10010299_54180 [Streptomyces tanashiensis]
MHSSPGLRVLEVVASWSEHLAQHRVRLTNTYDDLTDPVTPEALQWLDTELKRATSRS